MSNPKLLVTPETPCFLDAKIHASLRRVEFPVGSMKIIFKLDFEHFSVSENDLQWIQLRLHGLIDSDRGLWSQLCWRVLWNSMSL